MYAKSLQFSLHRKLPIKKLQSYIFLAANMEIMMNPVFQTIKNKLGQRQSQTSISSAFWVQKDFGLKKCSVQKKF